MEPNRTEPIPFSGHIRENVMRTEPNTVLGAMDPPRRLPSSKPTIRFSFLMPQEPRLARVFLPSFERPRWFDLSCLVLSCEALRCGCGMVFFFLSVGVVAGGFVVEDDLLVVPVHPVGRRRRCRHLDLGLAVTADDGLSEGPGKTTPQQDRQHEERHDTWKEASEQTKQTGIDGKPPRGK